MNEALTYFPLYAWDNLPQMPKTGDPSKLCPAISFINDFNALRGDLKHHAIDLFAPEGTPIIAPVSGVLWANKALGDQYNEYSYFERGGWHCYIFGDDGRIHYFAHMLGRPLLEPGHRVTAGTIIGFVGQSGVVYGCPHLHYAMYAVREDGSKGSAINPYPFLVEAYEFTTGRKPPVHKRPYATIGLASLVMVPILVVIGVLSSRKKRRR